MAEEIPKSLRTLETSVKQGRAKLVAVADELKTQVDLARAAGAEAASEALALEMKSALNKLKAIELVLNADQKAWKEYLAGLKQEAADTASVNTHGSANLGAMMASGPCHNFELIQVISEVSNKKDTLKVASTAKDLDSCMKEIGEAVGLWTELCQNSKRCAAQLKMARAKSNGPSNSKGGKRGGKGTAKGKGSGKGKGSSKGTKMFEIFNAAKTHGQQVPVVNGQEGLSEGTDTVPADQDLSEPFVMDVPWISKDALALDPVGALTEDLATFEKEWKASDLRTSDLAIVNLKTCHHR